MLQPQPLVNNIQLQLSHKFAIAGNLYIDAFFLSFLYQTQVIYIFLSCLSFCYEYFYSCLLKLQMCRQVRQASGCQFNICILEITLESLCNCIVLKLFQRFVLYTFAKRSLIFYPTGELLPLGGKIYMLSYPPKFFHLYVLPPKLKCKLN